jgi:ataxia telangiectasia mutated family protein
MPADLSWASLHSVHTDPVNLVNLLRVCCGQAWIERLGVTRLYGGTLYQTWMAFHDIKDILGYTLLLSPSPASVYTRASTKFHDRVVNGALSDPASSHVLKRRTLELFLAKVKEMKDVAESWLRRTSEGGSQVSRDRLQSMMAVCISGSLISPIMSDLNSTMSTDVGPEVSALLELVLKAAGVAGKISEFKETIFASIASQLPGLNTKAMEQLIQPENKHLLKTCITVSRTLLRTPGDGDHPQPAEVMEIDDDFDMAPARDGSTPRGSELARRDVYLRFTQQASLQETALRLRFLAGFNGEEGQVGLIPPHFIDEVIGMTPEQFLLSSGLLKETFQSDLVMNADDALTVVRTLGDMVADTEYQHCEALWCAALDVMEGFVSLWTDDQLKVSGLVGDLYVFLVKRSLPGNWLSPKSTMWLARLLFKLLAVKPDYGSSLGQESCKTTLFSILNRSMVAVKYFVSAELPEIFSFYVLKKHEDIFLDILDNLPADPEQPEGIAFRMSALTDLACKWPTLLRRCVYHIFEAAGRIRRSGAWASKCLEKVSASLSLAGPQELFRLFSPQLLYTWLEEESIDDIPYQIFGYATLLDLIRQTQTEAVAIMMMRGQDRAAAALAEKLGRPLDSLVRASFPKVLGYSIAHDISVPTAVGQTSGESRLRRLLGKEGFLDAIYKSFVEIIAVFFNSFDQEGTIEKSWRKELGLADAAQAMDLIKSYGHLDVQLPPDQQPTFKGKFLVRQIEHLCSRTQYDMAELWTSASASFVIRRLLNSLHPAFGPLHACSVLRKVRVVICLAGPHVLTEYPLEMLLLSMRSFVVDPECADDALGISRYLITHGASHLRAVPSFMTGYALSTLADLRVFLESSQASTTQESQFKATKSKAQVFHTWLAEYLLGYRSPNFKDDDQRRAFQAITQAAAHIRASGNAEKGTNESALLLEIIKDGEGADQLLNQTAREIALSMLCGRFQVPEAARVDIIDTDQDAVNHGSMVWRSCKTEGLSSEYLAWAGRVIGRSFAACGAIDDVLVREARFSEDTLASLEADGSEAALLRLLQRLSAHSDHQAAGLAEAALRSIVSDAEARQDSHLLSVCQRTMREPLFVSSRWTPYSTAPSDLVELALIPDSQAFEDQLSEGTAFAESLTIYAAQSVAADVVLMGALAQVLSKVKGFAEQAFPFIIHLVLLHQLDKQPVFKRKLSAALRRWLDPTASITLSHLTLLTNTTLYLRTQPLPNEKSIADRTSWLDVNYADAAAAATRCGLFKVALLFSEIAFSETSRSSRRSSAPQNLEEWQDVLLTVFENLDDPDARYGLAQEPSLESVLARLQYENDGRKTLAFMGAQYDSHLRLGDPGSEGDAKSLVKALGSLGLAGLSHSLQQAQQTTDLSFTELSDTFTSSRKIEKWNLPVVTTSNNAALMLYKTYQTIHSATEFSVVQKAIYEAMGQTSRRITTQSMKASVLRSHLAALAALTELDDFLHVEDFPDMESILTRLNERSKWMMSGR